MVILLTILHILICVFLVIVVLLQSGKAADLAGAFGGMGSQTAFGPRGSATVLSKATTIAAALFMVTSLSLAILATRGAGAASSVTERSAPASAPAKSTTTPAPAPAAQTPQAPATGQPSVTVTPMTSGGQPGASKTMPLPIQPPSGQQSQPAAPAKK
jgi:preprotein translocase subunit SecG